MAAATAEKTTALDVIRELYNAPDKFVEIALNVNTAGIEAHTHDWFRTYPSGIFVTDIRFSKDYITSHPEECFVRSMLADASMCEGRGRDIFRGVPEVEREKLLRDKIINEYIIPKELRLVNPPVEDFMKLFTGYADKNNISSDKRERMFYKRLTAELPRADIIEIGGSSESSHLYYITSKDMVYIINFGEWKVEHQH